MNSQQETSPKNLRKNKMKEINKYTKGALYVEYKTFRQEAAEIVNKFAKHFGNEKNVSAMKTNICAFIDDMASHANTINKAKSSGLGHGIANIIFPQTIKAINQKKNKKEPNKA
jgi:hypothetical protein